MQPSLQEQLCLCAGMIDKGSMRSLAIELPSNRFHYGPGGKMGQEHCLIYEAMITVFRGNKDVNIGSVAVALGPNLSHIGGEAYLRTIVTALDGLNINSLRGLPQWAEVVDTSGQLYLLRDSLSNHLDGLKDIPEVLASMEHPHEYIVEIIRELGDIHQAKTEYESINILAARFREQHSKEARGHAITWLPIGWEATKRFKILPYKSLFVLQGLSSIGKSQLLIQFVLGAAMNLKINNIPGVCLLNTFEMSADAYTKRMIGCLSGLDMRSSLVSTPGSAEYNRVMEISEFLEELPIVISDAIMTTGDMSIQVNNMAAQHGTVHVLGIDFAELVGNKDNGSEEQRVSSIFRGSQQIAHSGPCVILVSQVSIEKGSSSKIAGPWGTRYSRAGWHTADIMGEVYNPPSMRANPGIDFVLPDNLPDGDHAYLLIIKNKDGPLGWIKLNWEPTCTQFSDPLLGQQVGLYYNFNELRTEFRAKKDREDF